MDKFYDIPTFVIYALFVTRNLVYSDEGMSLVLPRWLANTIFIIPLKTERVDLWALCMQATSDIVLLRIAVQLLEGNLLPILELPSWFWFAKWQFIFAMLGAIIYVIVCKTIIWVLDRRV